MTSCAADNDVLYKGAWYGLLQNLLAAVSCAPADTFILGEARFVVAKKIRRQQKKGVPDVERALKELDRLINDLQEIEPTSEETAMAAELENTAAAAGLPFDAGESLLAAVFVHRNLQNLVTGDKRAIGALEKLAAGTPLLASLRGRVLCLEQLFWRVLLDGDSGVVRGAVCRSPHADTALAVCFSCATMNPDPEQWKLGLRSYIEDVRRAAPSLLSEAIP